MPWSTGQDRDVARAGQAARVEQPLQVAQDLRGAVGLDEDAVDEVGTGQVQVDRRSSVVHSMAEQRLGVVAEQLLQAAMSSVVRRWSAGHRGRASQVRSTPRGAQLHRARLHDRHRGGADDRRRARRSTCRTRSRSCSRTPARARSSPSCMESRARDRHGAVREHAPRRASSCARCAPGARRPRRAPGLRIGSAGTHPFALWEEQRIVAPASATAT